MTDMNIINAVDRALDMLIYMYNAGTEVSITKISEDMGVYKSTVFRTLATLEAKIRRQKSILLESVCTLWVPALEKK